jgi:hypothetical protein
MEDNDCCTPNIPYNPPSWNPGDPCILSEIYVNNINLKYVIDDLKMDIDIVSKYDIVDTQGFNSWNIISGNASIVDNILSQDGTEESVIEREIDTCIYDFNVVGFSFLAETGLSPEINIIFDYIDSNDNIIFTNNINCKNLPNLEFMINNAICNSTVKPKIRITLPVGFELNLRNANLYKY